MNLLGDWCDARVDAALKRIDDKQNQIDAKWKEAADSLAGYRQRQLIDYDFRRAHNQMAEYHEKAIKEQNDLLKQRLEEMDRRMETIAAALYARLGQGVPREDQTDHGADADARNPAGSARH